MLPSSVKLSGSQLTQLESFAKISLPNESCALLLGKSHDCETAVILEVLPMKNADNSYATFSIEPSDLFAAYGLAEEKGMDVVGIFHSHPSRPYPSLTDKKYMEINPVIWIIYSTTDCQMKAFLMENNGTVRDVSLVVA